MTQRTLTTLLRGSVKPHLYIHQGRWICTYFEPAIEPFGANVFTDSSSPVEAYAKLQDLRREVLYEQNRKERL